MTAFVDTNVLLYLFSDDARKADRAEQLIAAGAVISVQVLNELVAVARRKLGMDWSDISEAIGVIQSMCMIEPLSVEIHDGARRVAEQYQLAWCDALIVSSALAAGCDTLFTEDMHEGLRIGSMTVRNPFI